MKRNASKIKQHYANNTKHRRKSVQLSLGRFLHCIRSILSSPQKAALCRPRSSRTRTVWLRPRCTCPPRNQNTRLCWKRPCIFHKHKCRKSLARQEAGLCRPHRQCRKKDRRHQNRCPLRRETWCHWYLGRPQKPSAKISYAEAISGCRRWHSYQSQMGQKVLSPNFCLSLDYYLLFHFCLVQPRRACADVQNGQQRYQLIFESTDKGVPVALFMAPAWKWGLAITPLIGIIQVKSSHQLN